MTAESFKKMVPIIGKHLTCSEISPGIPLSTFFSLPWMVCTLLRVRETFSLAESFIWPLSLIAWPIAATMALCSSTPWYGTQCLYLYILTSPINWTRDRVMPAWVRRTGQLYVTSEQNRRNKTQNQKMERSKSSPVYKVLGSQACRWRKTVHAW